MVAILAAIHLPLRLSRDAHVVDGGVPSRGDGALFEPVLSHDFPWAEAKPTDSDDEFRAALNKLGGNAASIAQNGRRAQSVGYFAQEYDKLRVDLFITAPYDHVVFIDSDCLVTRPMVPCSTAQTSE
eukprot:7391330-Prymnesium_polylepis.1